MRRKSLGRLASALLGAALAALCHAQPTTENQARYYVYGAFLTHAVPEIMGQSVALGPELEQRLGLAANADRLQIYDALMSYTDGKRISVRKATAQELASYKRNLRAPVFTVQAGEIALLVEYDMQANTIPFVGQLAAAYQPPVAKPRAAPVVEAIAAPKPAAPPPPPAPARVSEPLKPNGPCVVRPVMSEQDLANCRDAPRPVARAVVQPPPPPPPPAAKPQARVEPAPQPRRTGPCEVKPVMSEEDLANCRAAAVLAPRLEPGPPVLAKPQPRVAPVREPARTRPCEIKPVMSEEDRIACGIR